MLTRISKPFFTLPRWQKRIALLTLDCVLLPFSVWAAFALRLGKWNPELNDGQLLLLLAPLFTIPIFLHFNLYRTVIRYITEHAIMAVLHGVTLSTLVLAAITTILGLEGIPRSVFIIYWGTAFLLVGGSRYWMRSQYHRLLERQHDRTRTIIYGAGNSGMQLVKVLANSPEYHVVALVDDNPSLHKATLQGLKVYPSTDLPAITTTLAVAQILLAIPSASNTRRREILQQLEPLPVQIRTLPSLNDLVDGKITLADIREISIDDLLGRDAVPPDNKLLHANITGKVVMVTGAGGSIGSELCRQIAKLAPQQLLLFEQSEYALYSIDQELSADTAFPVIPLLGSVTDTARLQQIMRTFVVQTIYHAAAYKHVPMVEHNVLEGIRNNIIGTWRTAQAARLCGVETFVLISTDKAVRPTNTMGATKRYAELSLQALASIPAVKTRFTMVRFGNVLGSSGSVVPLFREQIRQGGPITLTHRDIIRYFMTIPEAAQLVIQAGAMGEGGDVFVLDMGEPVRIYDLAARMVKLSGLQVRDAQHPDGDIEIHITGLRPGEKLYEELLIGDNVLPTRHPRILRAQESKLPLNLLEGYIRRFELLVDTQDPDNARILLQQAVQEFKPQCPIVDVLHTAQQANPLIKEKAA
ncbi:MAG: polysaccharide biosynthesis protein [Gammaproteobacteria bacterium]|nr:polysaccharide biosynthesis protein [Gammaproteobacteria bacterium]MBU1725340.1 polysaccharide biosynthesis protein [Gammaproteobacteria bacterium]MBU2004349.1 polysaccharide biosynthesis protein [Gammaproteobacteria bacterium]